MFFSNSEIHIFQKASLEARSADSQGVPGHSATLDFCKLPLRCSELLHTPENNISGEKSRKLKFLNLILQHLFLNGWDPTREIHAYPPALGTYALYRQSEFYDFVDFAVNNLQKLEKDAIGPFFMNSSVGMCIDHMKVTLCPGSFSFFHSCFCSLLLLLLPTSASSHLYFTDCKYIKRLESHPGSHTGDELQLSVHGGGARHTPATPAPTPGVHLQQLQDLAGLLRPPLP